MKIGNLNIKKKHLFIFSVFFLLISIVVGYSYINSDVKSTGGVTLHKYSCNQENLYERLKCLSTIDGIASKNISDTFGIDYSAESGTTNGKGLYTMTSSLNDDYPMMYYRGAVENNNIKFNNMCWQIVRTTETGGTKIIYAGLPDENGYCNNSTLSALSIPAGQYGAGYDKPYYASYMYDDSNTATEETDFSALSSYKFYTYATYSNGQYTLSNPLDSFQTGAYTCASNSNQCSTVRLYTGGDEYYLFTNGKTYESLFDKVVSSPIKNTIENWFGTNLTSVEDKIEDTTFCADMTPDSSNIAESLEFYKLANKKISLECYDTNYEYSVANGALSKPVGLITMSEAELSSGFADGEQKIGNTYLTSKIKTVVKENGDSFWTMSPGSSRAKYASVLAIYKKSDGTQGGSKNSPTATDNYIRPVISLKNSVTITGGDGTENNPYVVQ